MEKHLVIIGAVAAGTKAAAKARREDPKLKISVYTDEEFVSYSACGLPYYIEDTIHNHERLLVRTTEEFKEKENIDIYTNHRVTKILPASNKIQVNNLDTKEVFEVNYTSLLIATGAIPFVPPISGIKTNNVFTLRNINDGINIKDRVTASKNAIIIGGGYIGIEMFEALVEQGLNTTLIESANHIMPIFDDDMAILMEDYVRNEVGENFPNKAEIITNNEVTKILSDENNNVIAIETSKGQKFDADLVIISTGVRPNVKLAKEADIEIGSTGAIKVNSKMQTSIENIYAAGDCAEQFHIVSEKPVWVPLGSTANKQGRVAAINITGGIEEFKGILGSAITKLFDYTIALTGLSEKEARKENMEYEIALVHSKDRAGYMPNANIISMKLMAEKGTGKILGAQIIGKGDVDKRINVIATALSSEMTVNEFLNIDLAYAPPFSTAIDPILKTAQVLQNKLYKKLDGISCQDLQKYLDKKRDINVFSHEQFSELIKTKPEIIDEYKTKELVLYCEGGMHSYILGHKLKKNGFNNVKFIDGGLNTEIEQEK